MKYLITESQFDKVIFKYLDNQDFIIEKLNNLNITYFLNSENDSKPLIKYYKHDGECVVRVELVSEIATFFSLGVNESKVVIAMWVEKTLGVRVTDVIIM